MFFCSRFFQSINLSINQLISLLVLSAIINIRYRRPVYMGSGLTGSLSSYIHYIIYYMYISLANNIVVVVGTGTDNTLSNHTSTSQTDRQTDRR